MGQQGTCKLTGGAGKLVRAHIIPRSFYLLADDKPLVAVANNVDRPLKRIRTGIYDENLVIESTEARFAIWDDYAARVLLPQPNIANHLRHRGAPVVGANGQPGWYQLTNLRYDRLKLFFMSVLWRASATSRAEFNSLNLGPHAERLRNAICAEDPMSQEDYSVVILRFSEGADVPVRPFFMYRHEGVQFFQAFFGGFRMMIKCDKRRTPPPLDYLQLTSAGSVIVPLHSFSGSADQQHMADLIRALSRAHGDPWLGRRRR